VLNTPAPVEESETKTGTEESSSTESGTEEATTTTSGQSSTETSLGAGTEEDKEEDKSILIIDSGKVVLLGYEEKILTSGSDYFEVLKSKYGYTPPDAGVS
jgi:hypothetical protein